MKWLLQQRIKTVLHYCLQGTNLPKQNVLLKEESRKLASKITDFGYVFPSRLQAYESLFFGNLSEL